MHTDVHCKYKLLLLCQASDDPGRRYGRCRAGEMGDFTVEKRLINGEFDGFDNGELGVNQWVIYG